MPLYRISPDQKAIQIKPGSFSCERVLQKIFEASLETLLGVCFVGHEFTTGDRQRGRIDTLGLDQDGYPTIIEYKKSNKENIINQGLFYLDWLVDHKGDFALARSAIHRFRRQDRLVPPTPDPGCRVPLRLRSVRRQPHWRRHRPVGLPLLRR